MNSVVIKAKVDENHCLILVLPDVLPGEVEVELRVVPKQVEYEPDTREWVHDKLKTAGLVKDTEPSPDALNVSAEERTRLSKIFLNLRPLSEEIIEDREDRI